MNRYPPDVRVLLLSPHPDDLAWSLGGTLARLSRSRSALHAVTFFSQTQYAPGSPAHGSVAASDVRAVEEDAWAALAGVRLKRVGLPDASLRGYTDDTEMGASPEPEIVRDAIEHLRVAIAAVAPHVIFAPLAIGRHVDHHSVRLAIEAVRPHADVMWYEDLPYAASGDLPSTGHPVVVDIGSEWPAKEAGVRCFPSQLPSDVLPVLRGHATAVAGERLWAATRPAAGRLRHLM